MKSLQVNLAVFSVTLALSLSAGIAVASEHGINQSGVIEGEDVQLNGTDSEVPMLEQTSEKGIYLVQLRWAQLQLDPNDAIALEIVFLNASIPRDINEIEPPVEGRPTNETVQAGPEGGDVEVDSTLPVESYNMTVYSEDGREIWKKINQPGEGGRAGQLVDLGSNYSGPVTIQISEIVPGWDTNGADPAEVIDSVTFSAVVVPEFPLPAVVAIVTGVIVTLTLIGTRLRNLSRWY